jgi:hypothetical protein
MPSYPRVGRPPAGPPPDPPTPAETARYTAEMLESLRKIAAGQGHGRLVHLLGLAAVEAKYLADQPHETLPPG